MLKRSRVSTGKRIYFVSLAQCQCHNLRGLHPNLNDLWNFFPLKVNQFISIKLSCFVVKAFLERDVTCIRCRIFFLWILHKAHEEITFLTPLPNRLWIYHKNCLYPANLYSLNNDKHKISYSSFVNFITLET